MGKVYYDPVRDEIVGALPGSFSYCHELRHREQYKYGKAALLDDLHVICYYASFLTAIGGLVVGGPWGMVEGIGLAFLPHWVSIAYLEADAYIMGYIYWRRKV